MPWVALVAGFGAVADILYVGYGLESARRADEEKRRALREAIGNRIVVIREAGGTGRSRKRVGGVLRDITRGGVALDTGRGEVVFIALGAIRAVEDDRGRSLGDW